MNAPQRRIEIRDPVHGPIALSAAEQAVIDSPYFQRLRNIKQLGFSELTWPGATHTRFLHSIGALHLAGLAFDAALRDTPWLPDGDRARLRQTVRLAALCHDLGHPPLSHSSEMLLPPLPGRAGEHGGHHGSHEDYTLQFLLASGLTGILRQAVGSQGIAPEHIAALISDEVATDPAPFTVAGHDLKSLLSTLISSELDVDRMDYLLRDSYFTGVSYGQFDVQWLVAHLCHYIDDAGKLHLGLQDRAVFTFDDFLLSRHHMFLMVYFHKKSVCYDHMLRRFYEQFPQYCRAPADPEAYLQFDDHALWRVLRGMAGQSPWAGGIVHRQPLELVAESTPSGKEPIEALVDALRDDGIDHLRVTSHGALSKYRAADRQRRIFVCRRVPQGGVQWTQLGHATQLFERYAEQTTLERVYVWPADAGRVGERLGQLRMRG